ncbi:hypothetical protein [Streptantibioticus cattleyicolor]|uniref:Uncharacterized protein n=1 Tax=Streptantibioticus cattleyicolor (strain ATCC 35852 / DSM 46488 / JCM 4925 / NBRC 14057 / NRRL 8057) TaxID=1003195 RepID=F8JJC4_STREN|nr:hypothetical protein [Streptantibioticus cattleyicolor]AEW98761.1 hypothetical protein SCATT_p05680 [Streptantibioticus cattleyicolor NRRL 8057 = DSM 46488]CCB72187.1 protein of unknown function [Streptantibioticus cattleyicolor NRRL 8057 = DSM 46488]
MSDIRTRLADWWSTLGDTAKERLLSLGDDDHLPASFANELREAGVFPVSDGYWPGQETSPDAFRQPHELRAFLNEQRLQ